MKRHLRSMGSATHGFTSKMHRDFHRALLAMAICPLITSAVPILFIVGAAWLELTPGSALGFLEMTVSSITMFNPITTVFFIRSYRQVILKPFKRKRTENETTRVTGLSMIPAAARTITN
ncbi:hypothetical protein AAVH_28091 [Aphelenchoides avenae]|nr:hypothetical protein AAVH_28091 [Aphelenchus avenae]